MIRGDRATCQEAAERRHVGAPRSIRYVTILAGVATAKEVETNPAGVLKSTLPPAAPDRVSAVTASFASEHR